MRDKNNTTTSDAAYERHNCARGHGHRTEHSALTAAACAASQPSTPTVTPSPQPPTLTVAPLLPPINVPPPPPRSASPTNSAVNAPGSIVDVFFFIMNVKDITNSGGGIAPFDELISGALQLVRPIFGTAARQFATSSKIDSSKEQQRGNPKPKSVGGTPSRLSSARLRELDILGINSREEINAAEELPEICQGDSRICKFIACTAHNFKRGQSFANLQMMAHILGDRKMRQTVGGMNSDAVNDACREHGMGSTQCALFTRAFRLIDKFMTTIEDGEERHGGGGGTTGGVETVKHDGEREEKNANADPQKRPKPIVAANQPIAAQQSSSTAETTQKTPMIETKPTLADLFVPQNDATENSRHSTETRGIKGSRTWSTHQRHRGLTRSLPTNNLMDGGAIEENKRHHLTARQQQHQKHAVVVVETRKTLISYKKPSTTTTVQDGHNDYATPAKVDENGTAILINGNGISAAQRVAPERRNLARPLLKNTLKPMVAQKSSLIPYAHQILTTTIKPITESETITTARLRSFIAEAEEFEDEKGQHDVEDDDAVVVVGAAEVTTNELTRWRRRRMKDGAGGGDYYEELSATSAGEESADNKSTNSKRNSRNRSSEFIDSEQQQDENKKQQQMDNCLQYLG
ncbi:hypothetical protein niasHT_038767 [Heterodera trifolii]|uniref:Uncharacterized protein n=1 Tax=Heterodera trifolii TaxID=157864 RepID=A0ABD2ISZ2_9BILA